MITLIIVVILLCSAMSDSASASDWETSERNAERRHNELMEATKSRDLQLSRHREDRKILRRVITDSYGNKIAEEYIDESVEDF